MSTMESRLATGKSLEGLHGTVPVPPAGAGFWRQMAGVRRPGLSRQRRLHGPRQLGHRPAGRGAVPLRPALGRGPVEPHGDHHAGDRRPAGRRHRQGPGPGLPRLLPALDALAQLAGLRGRHRRLRPGRGARQRRGASTCCSTSRCSGPSSSPPSTCCCCWRCKGWACGSSRRSSWSWSPPSAAATSSRSSSCRRRSPTSWRWARPCCRRVSARRG